jgi:DNA invertase Pin-like site-specific DNA recombinase
MPAGQSLKACLEYLREGVSSLGQDLAVTDFQLLQLHPDRFSLKTLSDDDGWLCSGDTLLVTKLDRLARSTPDLYRIVSQLTEWGVVFKVVDDPSIDTSTHTGKLITGILALIAEFENDIRRERQQDGINKAKAEGVRFGPKPLLTREVVQKIEQLRADGATVPEIMRRTKLSKASVYRALKA